MPGKWAGNGRLAASAWLVLGAAGCLQFAWLAGCSHTETPAAPKTPEAVGITQFYISTPNVARGERALICYGVENAKAVWLDPPRQELSAALSRCVEVTPAATTTYTLTAEGRDGKTASRSLTLQVGSPRARLVNVNVSSLEVKPGDLVSICYTVENAKAVTIEPLHFSAGSKPKGCISDQPRKSTTYVISAIGTAGDKDQERVTVKVR